MTEKACPLCGPQPSHGGIEDICDDCIIGTAPENPRAVGVRAAMRYLHRRSDADHVELALPSRPWLVISQSFDYIVPGLVFATALYALVKLHLIPWLVLR